MIFHIDLKTATPVLIEKTNELVKKYKREHLTVKQLCLSLFLDLGCSSSRQNKRVEKN